MGLYIILAVLVVFTVGFAHVNLANAQVDHLSEIIFFQTGELHTKESQFIISDNFNIREFFNGNIIRVSGQTIEGFPFITYSKIINDEIVIKGKIFINGKFLELEFDEKEIAIESITKDKKDDLSILIKYSQKAYSTNPVQFEIKIFDPIQNKMNDFNQNYGMIQNAQVKILVENNEEQIFSEDLIVNDKGLVETEFVMPLDRISTYTVTITAENDESKSTKIIQLINLGSKDGLK